jgi:hypothetical protein
MCVAVLKCTGGRSAQGMLLIPAASRISTVAAALYDEAWEQGWVVISMKND